MTICAVIAGADDYVAIAKFANTKKEWFAKFLDMSAGVPSHDRFNAILNAIDPEEFEPVLRAWITQCTASPTDKSSPLFVFGVAAPNVSAKNVSAPSAVFREGSCPVLPPKF